MADLTKADLINNAYSQLRISGLTLTPSSEDISIALDRLEAMMEEFRGRNICVGYNFEDSPDTGSPHNVERKYHHPIETNLAVRLCPDFGKTPPPVLVSQQRAGYSFLSSATAVVRETQYPTRHPIGSGNRRRYGTLNRFYSRTPEPPQTCRTHQMYIDDVDTFIEYYEAYLNDGETISSYTITSDDGLTVSGDTLNDDSTNITYTVTADGNDTESDNFLQVKIVVTTSDGRKETRFIDFQLLDSDL